jgi:hypothetical protein
MLCRPSGPNSFTPSLVRDYIQVLLLFFATHTFAPLPGHFTHRIEQLFPERGQKMTAATTRNENEMVIEIEELEQKIAPQAGSGFLD